MLKRTVLICTALLSLLLSFPVEASYAQNQSSSDLLHYFLRVRARKIATEKAKEGGNRTSFLPVDPLGSLAERLSAKAEEIRMQALLDQLPDRLDTFSRDSFKLINRLRTSEVQSLFDETEWAFTGSSSRSVMDTTRTADLRARLEHHFGPPTNTLAEIGFSEDATKEEIIQFEYWFVLDDSIAVMIMDVNGPWDRGIVLAADMRFRSELRTIKKHLLEQLISDPDRKPFVDYYFNFDQKSWYLTGFDGASFFDRRIQAPDLNLGRPSPQQADRPESEPED